MEDDRIPKQILRYYLR